MPLAAGIAPQKTVPNCQLSSEIALAEEHWLTQGPVSFQWQPTPGDM